MALPTVLEGISVVDMDQVSELVRNVYGASVIINANGCTFSYYSRNGGQTYKLVSGQLDDLIDQAWDLYKDPSADMRRTDNIYNG
jgi:hypothetical protein